MGKGLEKDPVVKELVLLACDVQLGQLQAPLGTHVLGVGRGGVAGSWDRAGSGGQPHPRARPPGRTREPLRGRRRRGAAHLLKEPDVEDGERAVQQVEEGQEPAFVQRLAGRTRRGRAVSLPPAGEGSKALAGDAHPNQLDPWGGFQAHREVELQRSLVLGPGLGCLRPDEDGKARGRAEKQG